MCSWTFLDLVFYKCHIDCLPASFDAHISIPGESLLEDDAGSSFFGVLKPFFVEFSRK